MNPFTAFCPTSLYWTRKLVGLQVDQFKQFVVCTKCNSIYYELSQCIGQTARGVRYSKCWYVQFPNHPHQLQRIECGMPLLDTVQSRSGGIKFRPKKVLLSIIKAIHK